MPGASHSSIVCFMMLASFELGCIEVWLKISDNFEVEKGIDSARLRGKKLKPFGDLMKITLFNLSLGRRLSRRKYVVVVLSVAFLLMSNGLDSAQYAIRYVICPLRATATSSSAK